MPRKDFLRMGMEPAKPNRQRQLLGHLIENLEVTGYNGKENRYVSVRHTFSHTFVYTFG